MLRKLSNGNKGNFVVFFTVILIIITILIAFLYISMSEDEPKYELGANTFFYDKEDLQFELKGMSQLEKKRNNN